MAKEVRVLSKSCTMWARTREQSVSRESIVPTLESKRCLKDSDAFRSSGMVGLWCLLNIVVSWFAGIHCVSPTGGAGMIAFSPYAGIGIAGQYS